MLRHNKVVIAFADTPGRENFVAVAYQDSHRFQLRSPLEQDLEQTG